MKLIFFTWGFFILRSIIAINLKSKLPLLKMLPLDRLQKNSPNIFVNIITQANSTATALNTGKGSANAVSNSVAQSITRVYC